MSAPAVHILLAQKVFDLYGKDKDLAEFIRGTSFADIRYTAKMDRNLTHFSDVTIDQIRSADSFTAGLLTHSLVDLSRAKFVKASGLIEELPESKYIGQTIKCYEDSLLYNKFTKEQWQKYVGYFDQISDLELTFGIHIQLIHEWHTSIVNSIKTVPTKHNIINFLSHVGIIDAENEVNRIFSELEKNKKIKTVISEYYENFEKIIEEYNV